MVAPDPLPQLEQAARLEALGLLASGVAHDFNDQLGVITAYTCLLLETAPSALRDDILEILAASERSAQLVKQLMSFSRRDGDPLGPSDLNQVIERSAALFRRAVDPRITLTTALDAELPRVRADEGAIEQLLVNLVVNARDAMPEGGTLRIETGREAALGCDGSGVCLRVRDTGCGMSPETLARIYEPFFTTKAAGHGTGLGLAAVRHLVGRLGGRIRCESEVGQGTTFTVWLPAFEASGEGGHPIGAALDGVVILVVDDEPMVRRTATRVLASRGCTAVEAKDGQEALALLERAPADLLLTDVVMPGMSGPDLARRARQIVPGLRVVFMSGHSTRVTEGFGIVPDAVRPLPKPFTPAELLRVVEARLANAREARRPAAG